MFSKIVSLIVFIAPLFLLKQVNKEWNVERNGEIVQVRIVEIPGSCLGTKVKWFMKFEYEGIIYPIQIAGNFCESHHIGDLVPLKTIRGSDIFLFPNYRAFSEFVSIGAMSIFGLGWFISQIIKKKEE